MLTRKKIVLAKTESSYGADATPDGANRINVTELEPSYYEGDRQIRERLTEHPGSKPEVNVSPYATLQITVPLAGSGVAGIPPVFGPLLKACTLMETINDTSGSESVTYTPQPLEAAESATIYYLEDGQQQKITGALGTATFNLQRGQFPTIQFTMTGMYHRPEAVSPVTPSAIDQADEVPVNEQNTPVFTVHGYPGCGESLSFDLANEVTFRDLIGCAKTRITDRNTTGQVNIEAPTLSSKNYFQAVESHQDITLQPLKLEHGTTAGNIVAFEAPKTQLTTISHQDSDGIVHYQMDARFTPDAGNDDFSLIFK